MRRWLKWTYYRWIDRRGRIPRLATWLWPGAHWCPEMDDLLILWNVEDCFCGHVEQPRAFCVRCGKIEERRWMNADHECVSCAPPWNGELF